MIREGDIVSVDTGAFYDDYNGDNAYTFAVGEISAQARALLDATNESLYEAIKAVKPGARIGRHRPCSAGLCWKSGDMRLCGSLSAMVWADIFMRPLMCRISEKQGAWRPPCCGMTLAIEPMVNMKGEDVKTMRDGWTVKTVSGSLSAHFEHTVAVTEQGARILTLA